MAKKIEILIKKRIFGFKIEMFVKHGHSGQKSKFSKNCKFWTKHRNLDQK